MRIKEWNIYLNAQRISPKQLKDISDIILNRTTNIGFTRCICRIMFVPFFYFPFQNGHLVIGCLVSTFEWVVHETRTQAKRGSIQSIDRTTGLRKIPGYYFSLSWAGYLLQPGGPKTKKTIGVAKPRSKRRSILTSQPFGREAEG
jgi:hypothetical protein